MYISVRWASPLETTDAESSMENDDEDDADDETLAIPWAALTRFSWMRSSARTRREL
jgi:hypothetical protein